MYRILKCTDKGVYGCGYNLLGELCDLPYFTEHEEKYNAYYSKLFNAPMDMIFDKVFIDTYCSYVITECGCLYGWGVDFGLGKEVAQSRKPRIVLKNVKKFVCIIIGEEPIIRNCFKLENIKMKPNKKYALLNNGDLYYWGCETIDSTSPFYLKHIIKPVKIAENVKDICGGMYSDVIIIFSKDGKIFDLTPKKDEINIDSAWPKNIIKFTRIPEIDTLKDIDFNSGVVPPVRFSYTVTIRKELIGGGGGSQRQSYDWPVIPPRLINNYILELRLLNGWQFTYGGNTYRRITLSSSETINQKIKYGATIKDFKVTIRF